LFRFVGVVFVFPVVNPCTHLCEEVVRRRYWKSLIPVNPLVCKSGSFVFSWSLLSSVLSFLCFHAITNHLLRLSSIIFDQNTNKNLICFLRCFLFSFPFCFGFLRRRNTSYRSLFESVPQSFKTLETSSVCLSVPARRFQKY
jgi:hypothetical protein